jgi:hypothetical protein
LPSRSASSMATGSRSRMTASDTLPRSSPPPIPSNSSSTAPCRIWVTSSTATGSSSPLPARRTEPSSPCARLRIFTRRPSSS